MPPSLPEPLTRTLAVLRLDLQPRRPLPSLARTALAGLLAVVGSVVADAILASAGKVIFAASSAFGPFHFQIYTVLTVLGVVAATVGWAILVRMTSVPRWFVLRAAVVVTIVLLVPDFLILKGNPVGPVVTLMVMHVVIAVITTAALLRVAPAPVRGDREAGRSEEHSLHMSRAHS